MKRTPIRKRGASEFSKLEDRADTLLQKLIGSTRRCAVCGWAYGVAGHHILPRSACHGGRYYMRYDLRNLIPLCAMHHGRAHANRKGFTKWMEENMASQWEWVRQQRPEDSGDRFREDDMRRLVCEMRRALNGSRL